MPPRCVETLTVESLRGEARAQLSPLLMGAMILTQASSIRQLRLYVGSAVTTGTDSIMLVSAQFKTFPFELAI